MTEIGRLIEKLRKERGLSQRELAGLVGVSNTEISHIENGKRKRPSPETIEKIARLFLVPPEQLLEIAGYTVLVREGDVYNLDMILEDKTKVVTIDGKPLTEEERVQLKAALPHVIEIVRQKAKS